MITLLHILKAASSTAEKEYILTTADTFQKQMFQYAYNPDKMYGVKFNNINWDNVKEPDQVMFALLDKLARRDLTGTAARDAVEDHAAFYGDLIKLMCNKDLDCGVAVTTLNRVFGKGFVPKFEVALATEVPINEVSLPILGQIKYNGVRVIAVIENQGVKFKTRNGKSFEFPKLAETLAKLRSKLDKDFILDGELTFGKSNTSDHTGISGMVNSAIHGTPINNRKVIYTVFDCMLLNNFERQSCLLPYRERLAMVEQVLLNIEYEQDNDNKVEMAETYNFETHKEIEDKFSELLSMGHEGLILKKASHIYPFKRSKDWIKLKETKSADMKCVGTFPGKPGTKYENMIGGLVCHDMVEGKWVEVDVGSGLTDADRAKPSETYVGQVIEVLFNTKIQDSKTEQWSLFLPRFSVIRGDLS